jgi:aldose 1-epimerase
MFEVRQEPFGNFEKIILKSVTSEVAFIPAFGANILSLKFQGEEILWGFENEEQLVANDKSRSIILAPFPNRIQAGNYFFEENYYQLPINKPKENNAIHGFVWNKKFEVVDTKTTDNSSCATLKYGYNSTEAGYPFPFELLLQYTLYKNSFSINFSVVNTGSSNMPFGFGWHPYFSFGKKVNDWKLQLPECNMLETNEQLIPNGNKINYTAFQQAEIIGSTTFDTAFELKGHQDFFETVLFFSQENTRLSIKQSSLFKYLQVYIPPLRNSIAIEPMTCPANAFNSKEGLIVLQPNQILSGNISIFFQKTLKANS